MKLRLRLLLKRPRLIRRRLQPKRLLRETSAQHPILLTANNRINNTNHVTSNKVMAAVTVVVMSLIGSETSSTNATSAVAVVTAAALVARPGSRVVVNRAVVIRVAAVALLLRNIHNNPFRPI